MKNVILFLLVISLTLVGSFAAANENASVCDQTFQLPSNQWRMISLPCDPGEDATVAEVFGDDIAAAFGENEPAVYGHNWILFRHDIEKGFAALGETEQNSLSPGVAYWMIQTSNSDATLSLPANSTATVFDQSEGCAESAQSCFGIPLATAANGIKWNMIGYPNTVSQNLINVRVVSNATGACTEGCTLDAAESQGLVHNRLWRYSGDGYTALDGGRDSLDPWDGYWLPTLNQAEGGQPKLLIGNGPEAFPAEHYPDGDHPRLWLSADRLSALQQARQQQTPQWNAFKRICDEMVDNNPNNDPYFIADTPQTGAAPLALMYRLTGENQYADRALELMDATPADISVYANPDHANFHYLGLAYDWLYNYLGMTPARKKAYQQKMTAISENFWKDYNGQGVFTYNDDTDANIESGMIHLTLGAAMYGDDSSAVKLLNRGWLGWVSGYGGRGKTPTYSNTDYLRESLGGVYPTGFAYFAGSDSVGFSGYQMTLETACHYDVNSKHPELKSFWGNTIRSMIHLTEPTRQKIYHTGDWQDPATLNTQAWFYQALAFASHFADKAGDSEIAAKGRGYAQQNDLGYDNGWFSEFLYSSPSAPVIDPYQNGLPLIRFANDPDFLMFRDNWSESANWGLFIGDGGLPVDHQKPDHGSFALWRGNDYLTRGVRTYDGLKNGDFFNTLSIENGCMINGKSCSGTAIRQAQTASQISRHRQSTSPLFAYGMLNADGQWNDDPNVYQPAIPVETYRRHFFWAGEYGVIFDRLRTHQNNGAKYRLRALTQPSVNGTTISQLSENGQHKMLHRTLEPSQAQIQILNEQDLWQAIPLWKVDQSERRWQSVINLPFSDATNVLNVTQTGSESLSEFDTLEHIKNAAQSGVRIGGWVVMFSSEEDLKDHVQYTVQNASAGMKHLVADLKEGSYKIKINGVTRAQQMTVQSNDNTGFFVSPDASSSLKIALTRVN